jgi:hypothetical protein
VTGRRGACRRGCRDGEGGGDVLQGGEMRVCRCENTMGRRRMAGQVSERWLAAMHARAGQRKQRERECLVLKVA